MKRKKIGESKGAKSDYAGGRHVINPKISFHNFPPKTNLLGGLENKRKVVGTRCECLMDGANDTKSGLICHQT